MASIFTETGETFATLVKGFGVTLRNLFPKAGHRKRTQRSLSTSNHVTAAYMYYIATSRVWRNVWAVSLCSAACPANCIYIEAAENTESQRISAGERYASVYNIDYSRCIFCGYCVEACPTDAITHGHGFELAPYNINALIYRKQQLLESPLLPRSSTAPTS